MLGFSFWEIFLIGAVALVVLGPERLPKAARILGTLIGRAQRYVGDVKAEVNRQVDMEALHKMQSEFQSTASDMQQTLQHSATELEQSWRDSNVAGLGQGLSHADDTAYHAPPVYVRPNKHWRARRSGLPLWYKKQQGTPRKLLSASARMRRHRT